MLLEVRRVHGETRAACSSSSSSSSKAVRPPPPSSASSRLAMARCGRMHVQCRPGRRSLTSLGGGATVDVNRARCCLCRAHPRGP
eukprot:10596383-Ditylum_brightwellii.AAC.1